MQKLKQLKKSKNSKLIADGGELVFKNGICEVKKLTKDINFFVSNGYLEVIKEK